MKFRRWPCVVATVVGVLAGVTLWAVLSFWVWFAAGGTLGGLGETASDHVDWGRLDLLGACWGWAPGLVAGTAPALWSWVRLRRAPTVRGRRIAVATLAAVVLAVVVAGAGAPVSVWYDRQHPTRVPPAVVAAVTRSSGAPVHRSLDKPGENGPWIQSIQSAAPVSPSTVVQSRLDTGRWWCSTADPDEWLFQASDASVWAAMRRHGAGVMVEPLRPPAPWRIKQLKACS